MFYWHLLMFTIVDLFILCSPGEETPIALLPALPADQNPAPAVTPPTPSPSISIPDPSIPNTPTPIEGYNTPAPPSQS